MRKKKKKKKKRKQQNPYVSFSLSGWRDERWEIESYRDPAFLLYRCWEEKGGKGEGEKIHARHFKPLVKGTDFRYVRPQLTSIS